ncbi:type I-E CRISPR-associated protein Cas6/Cse3/CasE [Pseudodesulfovibrio senegalensis]|uniref:Type I-E CRISPR-associated protein Cas6/Cse3/CasE n=1 Tax=Pseudodesulfovibrio senegalensis TaxID=1721087 RepID=A0A6N6N520_9BACT|nr:type I-E CRISPR-associated protein Cas6/Cse3/CasE [Pseudodesulfovibrio senegalensis]KAB1442878.1 type I-E CRISPR-associated protein Cas6/Cse3/CasE [Pseudodesulfovibrio senegalensis]
MFMSKIRLDMARSSHLGVYEAHQALWKLFSDSPDRRRDFLYRRLDDSSFLTVSERRPEDLPFVRRMEVKEYEPKLANGDRVLFSLRFNPVIKRREPSSDGRRGRQVRVDMVQDERKRLMREGLEMPSRSEIAQGVAEQWLEKRQQTLGLTLEKETVMAEAYDQSRFGHRGGSKAVVLSRIDARGFATVADAGLLEKALFQGVGAAKGFGFGLLLVRRA